MPAISHGQGLFRLCLALVVACLSSGTGAAQEAPGHRYELDATLDPARHEVRGAATIRFVNTSTRPLHNLIFHLYLNAFRNDESVFMRESGGFSRGRALRGVGAIELQTLLVDGTERLPLARRELVAGDFTQLELPLAQALLPGQALTIETEFVSRLPPAFARSGYAGEFFCVAQWFPKLAKLEATGDFASFPYHALGEFYADFAEYRLTVRAPSAFVVGANGKLIAERRTEKGVERTFAMARVHDAVWVASPKLREQKERHEGIDIRYLYPPGYELALREHSEITRAGLTHFGRRFAPYPYGSLTVVIPPRGAEALSGMEYPGLFMTAGPWFATPGSPGISGAFVTAHELAHQWFSGLLASNELRWPVLDEGFAQWAALDLMRERFGERGALSRFTPFSRFELERLAAFAHGNLAPPGLAAYAFTPAEYGSSVYSRAAIVLETLRRVYGRERFERAVRLYVERERFGHPSPRELARAFDEVYGLGFSDTVLLPLLIEGQASDVRIVQAHSARERGRFVTEVRARRSGEVALPTWVSAFAADGFELSRVLWPAQNEALHARIETTSPVARVAVDPDRALLVDSDVRDQVVELAPADRRSWLSLLLGWLQLALSWVGP